MRLVALRRVMGRSVAVAALLMGLLSGTARAHFTVVVPEGLGPALAEKGATLTLAIRFGHPFEREWIDVATPSHALVRGPRLDRGASRTQLLQASKEGGARTFRLPVEVDAVGDHVVLVESGAIRHGDEEVTDFAKVVVHAQAQRGWDAPIGAPVELLPLTRPYGLVAGQTVRFLLVRSGKSVPFTDVEIEKLRRPDEGPAKLPSEEQITRVEKTDGGGVVAATLPERGWYVVAASLSAGKVELADGTVLSRKQRALFWIYVGE